jgi:hypothetical protein
MVTIYYSRLTDKYPDCLFKMRLFEQKPQSVRPPLLVGSGVLKLFLVEKLTLLTPNPPPENSIKGNPP